VIKMQDYHPKNGLLSGRNILVTGAGSGIGQAVAKAFAQHGATIILLGRTEKKLEETYDAIESAGGPMPAIMPFNLQKAPASDYYALGETLLNEFGVLHGLVHCAAQLSLLSRVDDYDVETWNKVIQVNLTAPFILTQACLPLLRKSDDASIIFTSDDIGRKGKAYWGGYTVSKAGIEGLMETLADELERSQIRVNSVAPGPTRTALRTWAFPGEDPKTHPLPEERVSTYLYLAGPDSTGVTGKRFNCE
jgi:NAD(P)-dependent dehydrogenase (short-subunit alcohol dehydrogenase family)